MFDAGRSLQRLWLAGTSQGACCSPCRLRRFMPYGERGGIPAELQHGLAEGWKVSLVEAIPVMLARMGVAKRSSIVGAADYLERRLRRFAIVSGPGSLSCRNILHSTRRNT